MTARTHGVLRWLALLVAVAAAGGCGGDEEGASAERAAAPFAYDASQPLEVSEVARTRRVGLSEREISFAVAGGPDVTATVAVPARKESAPGVVYLHGAGGDRRDLLPLARRLARRGAVVLTLDWPEPGAAEAQLAGIPALEAQRDVAARAVVSARRALDVLASMPEVDDARLALVGWSGGGRIAALTAGAEPRLDAVVLMSAGAVPVEEYVRAAPSSLRAAVRRVLTAVDPLRLLHAAGAEVLLQNGRRDEVVPREALEAVAAAPPRAEARWYAAGHALSERAYAEQVDWLARRLRLAD